MAFEIVDSVAQLITVDSSVYNRVLALGYYAPGDAPPSWYYAVPSDTASAANGVTILKGNDGMRWYLDNWRTINFRRGGVRFDGSTDDAATILAVLTNVAPYGCVEADGGTAIVGSQINIPQSNITIIDKGQTTFKAASGAQFEYIMLGTGVSNVRIQRFTFDANQSNRTSGQSTRFMGAGFINATDCVFAETRAMNTLGYNGVSAVGLTLGGTCERCDLILPKAINCGTSASLSDGIYTSGNHNKIISPRSHFCTDTGTVIESSNFSSAIDVISEGCGAAAAITNATNSNCTGNSMYGIKGDNCMGGVTGVVSIGNPLSTSTGNLLATRMTDLLLVSKTSTGPGVNVRRTGSAATIGLSIDGVTINGMATQGMLIEANQFSVTNADIQGTGASSIQTNGTASDGRIANVRTQPPAGYFGVYSSSNNSIKTTGHVNTGGVYAEYFDGTASGCSYENVQSSGQSANVVGNSAGNVPAII
jgi:hypothetical protein